MTKNTVLLCLTLSLSTPTLASGQCILSPDSPGKNGQTRLQNFYTLVDNLYSPGFNTTKRILINGKYHQVPPWFNSSTQCAASNLKNGSDAINPPLASPSFTNFLVVSDELSELALVTSLANRDDRMMEIHNTVEAMESTAYPGLPCWIAEVNGSSITCRSQDTASDATARIGLAYYQAANNPEFPPASQAIYRAAGDALAARHLDVEYATGCYTSPVTGNLLCDWIAGGGNTASGPVGNLTMWIGYHQDIVRFLLAAYESTGSSVYAERAEDVVDQWLNASTFNGTDLTFGRFNFSWNTGVSPIAPKPGKQYFWDQGRAWDDADAPRALWMGDVLRAVSLATAGAPLSSTYTELYQWVQLVLNNGSQTATTSCIQYNQNGSWVTGNCGTDYYYNGLGAGLHTYHSTATATLDDKIDTALAQFGWTSTKKTWNNADCFGIYRGIRPVKALASAIGLDATTYGGTSCLVAPTTHTLSVAKTGSGSGTVTSSPSGVNCGTDCTESYGAGTVVALSASPAAGSTFAGWSGACTGSGSCQVTLDAAKSVSAAFSAPANLLSNPSFEQGTTGWTCNNCTLSSELVIVAEGQKSARISGRAGSWAGPTQTITQVVTNGKTYSISGFVRTTRPEGSTARFTFYLNRSPGGALYIPGPQASVSNGQFTQISGNVTLQWSGSLLDARVYVETVGDAADFYLDKVALSELP